jgi:hypothetical protein
MMFFSLVPVLRELLFTHWLTVSPTTVQGMAAWDSRYGYARNCKPPEINGLL